MTQAEWYDRFAQVLMWLERDLNRMRCAMLKSNDYILTKPMADILTNLDGAVNEAIREFAVKTPAPEDQQKPATQDQQKLLLELMAQVDSFNTWAEKEVNGIDLGPDRSRLVKHVYFAAGIVSGVLLAHWIWL